MIRRSEGAGAEPPGRFDPVRIALAGLLRCHEPPIPESLARLVNGLGPVDAWSAIAHGTAPADVSTPIAPRLAGLDPAELNRRAIDDLHRARAAGAELIGPDDQDWPADTFAGLASLVPYDGCRTAAPPLALYRRGGRWPTDAGRAVSVVGSRSATAYGQRVATELGAGLATEGFTVVSGAAFGVDVAAHRGALYAGDQPGAPLPAGGVTVAVLACGIDRSYPVAHRALLDAAAACGSVVSEYPPGAVPARHRFLVRNRLIAALAAATVVVEAGRRSGSLNTATSAGSLGRQVLAVPGPVGSAMSVGCHDLIRDRRAELVTGARDVIGLVGPLRPAEPVHRPGDRATDGLDLVTSRVHEALPARGGAAVDEVAAEAGLPVPDVLGALAELEMRDLAARSGGTWRRSGASPDPACRA